MNSIKEDQKNQKNDEKQKYIESLSQQEKEALEIAKKQLESSFCLEKSIGYLNYLQKKN
tara:strand:+ start:604 stop:780 length:177 start_codon:yes stop_codon:yes gene_type:complete